MASSCIFLYSMQNRKDLSSIGTKITGDFQAIWDDSVTCIFKLVANILLLIFLALDPVREGL